MSGIFGILNVTPDSFSDGGRYCEPSAAVDHARQLMADGADAVDVGAASSHPDAARIPPEEELQRLRPVVEPLLAEHVPVSIDSCQPQVQSWAIERGVRYLNDITGFPEPALHPHIAAAHCELILMHSIRQRDHATREPTEPGEVLASMFRFFEARLAALEAAGIQRSRIILDPGMGFFLGSNPETSLLALRELGHLRQTFGCRVLVSVSRKSFLGALTGRSLQDRGAATLAAELYAAGVGADYIRTHDVRALRDALQVGAALSNPAAVAPATA